MKKIMYLFVVLLCAVFVSCDRDPETVCGDYACDVKNPAFAFQLLDEETKQNVFEKGDYKTTDIALINTKTGQEVEMVYANGLVTTDKIAETATYQLKLTDNEVLEINVPTQQITEDCCTYVEFGEITLKAKYKIEHDVENDIYTIYLK